MNIKHRNSETNGRFYYEVDGEELAHMTYTNVRSR